MALLSGVRPVGLSVPDTRTVVGVFLAAVAAGLVLVLTRPPATTPVLVAGADLPAGQPLSSLDVTTRLVASGEGMITGDAVGELADWTLRTPLRAGEPLVPSLLVAPEVIAAPNAFGLTLDAAHAVQGKVGPGDSIDIIVTAVPSVGEAPVTRTVASNVYVLSVDIGEGGFDDSEIALVLAVDAETAGAIANAREAGTLDLVRLEP